MAGATRVPAPIGRRLIFVGPACNNHCVFCPQQTLRHATHSDVETELDASAGEAVALVGGEPTIHDELPDWIRRARSLACPSVLLQTNGRRFAYRSYAGALMDAGLDSVDISLHGARPAVHEYHTRVPQSFAQTTRGIRVAVGAGLRVGVTGVVTRSNVRHIEEIVRIAARLGATGVHLALARPVGTAALLFARMVPRLQTASLHLANAADVADRLGVGVVVSGVPLCALPRREHLALEHHCEPATVSDERFAATCAACALRPICPGVEPAYLARFGAGGLGPPGDIGDPRESSARLRDTAERFAGIGITGGSDVPLPRAGGPIG